jgi:hypothetical protein
VAFAFIFPRSKPHRIFMPGPPLFCPEVAPMNNSAAAQNRFQVFPFGSHEWCCMRADRMVCGFFIDREGALRFARREGAAEIMFTDASAVNEEGAALLPRAA